MSSYHEKRKKFYSRMNNFWPDLYGEEYALYDMAVIKQSELEQIRLASKRIGHIFFKVSGLLREVPDRTLLEMGYPLDTIAFIRQKTLEAESVISRLDLIPLEDSYKCIEINSDTPTFIKELFDVNGKVCSEFSLGNPNDMMEEMLSKAVHGSISECVQELGMENPNIVFTAHDDNIEDRETVLYLQKLSGVPSSFVPLHKLQIQKGIGLFDEDENKIDILYRQTFPIENLISDEDSEGNHIGLWLLDLVETGKLTIINPPSAFLLQNKAVQAVIWGLHTQDHPFFTKKEHEWIEQYFLPTYLEPDFFIEKGLPYVKKPSFGREGDTVEIYNREGTLLISDDQKSYKEYLPVFQQYVEQPLVSFKSEKGEQEGHLLLGCFLLNGNPAAVGYRVGGTITNNLSYFFPVGISENLLS